MREEVVSVSCFDREHASIGSLGREQTQTLTSMLLRRFLISEYCPDTGRVLACSPETCSHKSRKMKAGSTSSSACAVNPVGDAISASLKVYEQGRFGTGSKDCSKDRSAIRRSRPEDRL